MTMITPSYLGETIEYSSLHACRSTLEDPTSPSVEAIIAAFLEPLLRRLIAGDRGWRRYGRLASQLDVLPQFADLTGDVLNPTALHFINALRLALPKTPAPSIYWGYMFLIGAMVQVISTTGRIERLSRGLCHSNDIEDALHELVPFHQRRNARIGVAERIKQDGCRRAGRYHGMDARFIAEKPAGSALRRSRGFVFQRPAGVSPQHARCGRRSESARRGGRLRG